MLRHIREAKAILVIDSSFGIADCNHGRSEKFFQQAMGKRARISKSLNRGLSGSEIHLERFSRFAKREHSSPRGGIGAAGRAT